MLWILNTGTHNHVHTLNLNYKPRYAINLTRHQGELLGRTMHLSIMSNLSLFNLCLDLCCYLCVCRFVCQQLSESKELCTRLQDLEKELSSQLNSVEEGKQLLQEQYTDAQAKISALSQVCVCVCDVVV